ncbi:MAG: hypothetical protein HY914_06235 [Desulfomonile tiedjei]|nr:hypothetical protein [Desulfomonile tiedjei]
MPKLQRALWFWPAVVALMGVLICTGPVVQPGEAQILSRIAGGASPLMPMPSIMGEAKATPVWSQIEGGNNTLGAPINYSWGLRETFGMTRSYLFIDTMVRFQISRVSFRLHYEPREFVGTAHFRHDSTLPKAEARLEYSGIRLGLDFDILQWGRSRIGVDVDYNTYSPVFTEAIQTGHLVLAPNPTPPPDLIAVPARGKKMVGETPATFGFHITYIPGWNFYGFAPMAETRCRWPLRFLSQTDLTDLEFAVGLKAPETLLGSFAVKGGYRQTNLKWSDNQIFSLTLVDFGVSTPTDLDVTIGNWFGELAYYY